MKRDKSKNTLEFFSVALRGCNERVGPERWQKHPYFFCLYTEGGGTLVGDFQEYIHKTRVSSTNSVHTSLVDRAIKLPAKGADGARSSLKNHPPF